MHMFFLLFVTEQELLFAFNANPVLTTEGVPANVCVDLVSGTIVESVPIILDPSPGSANGKTAMSNQQSPNFSSKKTLLFPLQSLALGTVIQFWVFLTFHLHNNKSISLIYK